jgi:hypothetical protein
METKEGTSLEFVMSITMIPRSEGAFGIELNRHRFPTLERIEIKKQNEPNKRSETGTKEKTDRLYKKSN